MAKELYLYSPIYDFVAEYLISQMEENKDQDLVLRGNTPGGSVFSGWGIIAKMTEHDKDVLMKVDGYVASMGTYCLVFAKRSQALDVSRIHLHRADGYVNSPEDQEFLDGVNKDLKAKLIKKIKADKFKQITGFTIEDLFASDKKVEVWLTAKQAKEVGLVDKVIKLEPSEVVAMNERFAIAASLQDSEIKARIENKKDTDDSQNQNDTDKNTEPKNTVMNIEELKAKHPDLFAKAVAEGKAAGLKEEQERVRGWEAFRNIDAAAVEKGIKEGRTISATDIAEFTAKALSPEHLKKITSSNAPPVQTGESGASEKTEAQKELESLEAQVRKSVGMKPVNK